jgi:predicted anti-sigma-YlaC factor YlaD
MQCPLFRAAVSARLDGEPLGMSEHALDSHLGACAACAAWSDAAALVTRRARLAAAPPVPDLTRSVLEALPRELPGAAAAARASVVAAALRLALLAVGVAQAGLAWPALASGAGSMSAPVHMAHETGAWNLAVAVALVAVAAAPRLAAGTLAFLGSFVAFLAPVTLADLADGRVQLDRALAHLLLLAGTALVATVAWRGRERRERRVRRRVTA